MGDTGVHVGARGGLHSQCVIVGEILLGTLDRVRQELIDSGELGEYEEAAVETGRRQVIEYLITLHYRNRLEKGQVSVTVIKEEPSPVREQPSDWSPVDNKDALASTSRRKRKGVTNSSNDEPVLKASRQQEFETSDVSDNGGFSDHYSTTEDDDNDADFNPSTMTSASKKSSKPAAEICGKLRKNRVQRKCTSSKRRRKKRETQIQKEIDAKEIVEKQVKKMAEVKRRMEQEVVDEEELNDQQEIVELKQEDSQKQEADDDWDAAVTPDNTNSRAKKLPLNVVSHSHEISETLNHLKSLETDSVDFNELESLLTQQKSNKVGKGSYECDVCHKTYNYKKNLAFHKLKHNPNVFVCTKCNKRFTSHTDLQQHDREMHVNAFPFMCKVCGKGYRSRMGLKKHTLLTHDPTNKKHSCPVQGCKFATYDKNNLRDHLSIHTGAKNYTCPNCHKQYHSSNGLRRHQFLCLKGGLECQTCGRVFGSAHYLHIHIKAKHTDETFTCHDCGKTFEYKNNLVSHRKKHHSQSQPTESTLNQKKVPMTKNSSLISKDSFKCSLENCAILSSGQNQTVQTSTHMQNAQTVVCNSKTNSSQITTSFNTCLQSNIEDINTGTTCNMTGDMSSHTYTTTAGVMNRSNLVTKSSVIAQDTSQRLNSRIVENSLRSCHLNTSSVLSTSLLSENEWSEKGSIGEYQGTNSTPGAEIYKITDSSNDLMADTSDNLMDSVAGDADNIIHNLMVL